MTRILAVDPGEVRLGLALSDPSRTVARPWKVIRHSSRAKDAQVIVEAARHEGAETILVGVAYDLDGDVGPQARRAQRLVEAIRAAGFDRVETWDESDSTQRALADHSADRMTDARAAAFLLQSYLDATRPA